MRLKPVAERGAERADKAMRVHGVLTVCGRVAAPTIEILLLTAREVKRRSS